MKSQIQVNIMDDGSFSVNQEDLEILKKSDTVAVEVEVSHILIKEKSEAEDVLKKAQGGEAFGALAQAHSICPSKANGGNLGFFTKGQMVEAFEKSAFSLQKNTLSDLVETQFGFHIIYKTDERISIPVSL